MGVGKNGEGGEEGGPVVCPPGQRIGLAIGCSPPVDDVVGVGCQCGSPPGMPPGRSASRAEIFHVFVISVGLDRESWPLQVDSPLPERLHDS